MTTDVIIIGGGIIGCSLAESLSASGMEVIVVERGDIGHEASWAAAGMLAPQSEMPEPGPYLDFCLASRRMHATEAERLHALTGIDPQYRAEGMFYIAFTEEEERTLRERVAWQQAAGMGVRLMSAEEVIAAEPAVTREFRMAVHFQEDHQIDSRLLTRAYAEAAKMHGATLLEHSPVGELIIEDDRVRGVQLKHSRIFAPRVVLAAGCWSGEVARQLADRMPIPTYPVKGQMLMLQTSPPLFDHTMHSARIYLVPRRDGRVIVGATEEHDAGFDVSVQSGAIHRLLEYAFELVPALRSATLADSWAGLRPGTPDRRPIIGASAIEGLGLATGHFRNGVLLAPITARRMTEFIASGMLHEDLAPFSASRFFARGE